MVYEQQLRRKSGSMNKHQYSMRGKVWLYPGVATWHFLTLPKTKSKEITTLFGNIKRGWGSLPVIVRIGTTSWRTSIFPDSKAGAYLLPLKAEVRKKVGIASGDTITYVIEILT